ncbi:hypothetical protein SNE40_010968 [Patella caerulea]|uniref:Gustatory receptor n=1 Tax=Patella caerulea TaxID=87958 RepID=A0AAN8Q5R3_PATCE
MHTDKCVNPLGINRIQDVMKPVLVILELFGLFYTQRDNKIDAKETKDGSECVVEKKHSNKFKKMYCWVVLCCLAVSTLRYIPGFWTGASFVPGFTVLKVINASWFCQGLFSATVTLFNCHSGSWNDFFKLWNKAIQNAHCKGLCLLLKNLRRFAVICIIFAWVFWIFNVVGIFLMVFIFNTDFINSFTNPLPDNSAWRVILLLIHAYFSAISAFSIPLVLVCSKSIAGAFYLLSHRLSCAIKTNPTKFPANLEQLRRQHLELCNLVDILDRPMRILLVNLLTIYIFLACFNLYQLINSNNNLVNTMMMVMWLLTAYLGVGFVSWFAATVHEAVSNVLLLIRL